VGGGPFPSAYLGGSLPPGPPPWFLLSGCCGWLDCLCQARSVSAESWNGLKIQLVGYRGLGFLSFTTGPECICFFTRVVRDGEDRGILDIQIDMERSHENPQSSSLRCVSFPRWVPLSLTREVGRGLPISFRSFQLCLSSTDYHIQHRVPQGL